VQACNLAHGLREFRCLW